MTRVVLDANVLAPAFVNPAAAAGRLVALWRAGAFELVVSEPVLAELRRTYQDPYYARRLSPELPEATVALLRAEATLVVLTMPVAGVATHPEDDLVLATAASAAADYLGTRDRQLLKLGIFRGTRILHPADLADLLGPASAPRARRPFCLRSRVILREASARRPSGTRTEPSVAAWTRSAGLRAPASRP